MDQDPTDDQRTARRADLLPEEQAAGSENPQAQAELILEESDTRTFERDAAPDSPMEHRTSDDTTPPA